MIHGLLKKPDGICVLCRRRGYTRGGLEIKGWSRGYLHRLAKLHLYRFEHKNSNRVLRICVNCLHDLEFQGGGGVGGELGSPTRGTRKEAVG